MKTRGSIDPSNILICRVWILNSRTPEVIGTNMYQLVGKLNELKRVLKQLNKTNFSDIELKAGQAKEELEDCKK